MLRDLFFAFILQGNVTAQHNGTINFYCASVMLYILLALVVFLHSKCVDVDQ